MTVELTPEMETIVSDWLNSGRYSSAQAVLEEAFRALQSHESVRDLQTPTAVAQTAAYSALSQEERHERAEKMKELFALIDADGPFEDFEIERLSSPPDQRESWLT